MKGSTLLKSAIEKSENRITKPNDCYNSGIVNAMYKKNSGGLDFEPVQISVMYGKPKTFVFWKDGREFHNETISTSLIQFDGDVFSTRYFTIKLTPATSDNN